MDLAWVQEELELMLEHPDIIVGIGIGIICILVLWSIAVSTINIRRW